MVLPEPMPTYLAAGSKCSFTACWPALRFAASMSEGAAWPVLVVDIAAKVEKEIEIRRECGKVGGKSIRLEILPGILRHLLFSQSLVIVDFDSWNISCT